MSTISKTIIVGFVAGALSVLIFHQAGFWFTNELGLTRAALYSLRPVPPLGVPAIVSSAFWGGLWGILGAFLLRNMKGVAALLGWILFAAVFVTLVNWFVVLPIKGLPTGGGFRLPGVAVVPLVYALWGLGMGVIAALMRRAYGWR